jgi:histidinol phosphatase-like PHP family hydrolase
LEFVGFTEHVGWPGGGYWYDTLRTEFEEIDKINQEDPGVRVFKGIEVNILKNGSVDGPTDLLDQADLVVASHHYRSIEPVEESTAGVTVERWLNVMERYPQVNILGHPLRELPESEWPKIDWDLVCKAAKVKNVAIEVGIGDSAPEPPHNFLAALRRNGNIVSIAPDFHNTRDYLGDKEQYLSDEQLNLLSEYFLIKSRIATEGGYSKETTEIHRDRLAPDQQAGFESQVKEDWARLKAIEETGEIDKIYEILSRTEKIPARVHLGETEVESMDRLVEKYPLSIKMLLHYARRMDDVRKSGIQAENIINLWDTKKLQDWIVSRRSTNV